MALRMYCIDTEALVFMFNGGSPYGFTIHSIFTRICMLGWYTLKSMWIMAFWHPGPIYAVHP